jgi:hypothetical protein
VCTHQSSRPRLRPWHCEQFCAKTEACGNEPVGTSARSSKIGPCFVLWPFYGPRLMEECEWGETPAAAIPDQSRRFNVRDRLLQRSLTAKRRPLVSGGQKRCRWGDGDGGVPIGDHVRLTLTVSGQFQLVLLLLASLPPPAARRERLHQEADAAHRRLRRRTITERTLIYLRFLPPEQDQQVSAEGRL